MIVWKTIPTFPDYEISSDARIRKVDTKKEIKIYKKQTTAGTVQLWYKGKMYGRAITKLMRTVFNIDIVGRHYRSGYNKCPNCGAFISKTQINNHLSECKPRDNSIEYFEF